MKRVGLFVAILVFVFLGYRYRREVRSELRLAYGSIASTDHSHIATNPAEPAKTPEKSSHHAKTEMHVKKHVGSVITSLDQSDLGAGETVRPLVSTSDGPVRPHNTPYGVTIVGTEFSYGQLKDLGIFRDQSVYTVYIAMEIPGPSNPAWILQYTPLSQDTSAFASASSGRRRFKSGQSVQIDAPVQAPIPLEKVYPRFPAEIVARHPGEMILLYFVVTPEGKISQNRIVRSSVPELNQPVRDAMREWAFQPAKINGEPVAIKCLLRIVLPDAS